MTWANRPDDASPASAFSVISRCFTLDLVRLRCAYGPQPPSALREVPAVAASRSRVRIFSRTRCCEERYMSTTVASAGGAVSRVEALYG